MPRPRCVRKVSNNPRVRGLKPIGLPVRMSETLSLGLDEVEALKLADLEGLYQEEAARRMGISRPTFSRLLTGARRVLAKALIEQSTLFVGPSPATITDEEGEWPCPVHVGRHRRGRRCLCHDGDEPDESAGSQEGNHE
ncbi:MAG: DUF134 domain-containing protein [Acidobacteriota bacterium]|jgi:uncharacterized protein